MADVSLPLETLSDTNIEFLAGNRDQAERAFLSWFFVSPPLSSFRPFSGAPSRDTPLDSASFKRIITVIKRIKVILSCAPRSPVSRKVEGIRE